MDIHHLVPELYLINTGLCLKHTHKNLSQSTHMSFCDHVVIIKSFKKLIFKLQPKLAAKNNCNEAFLTMGET